MTGEITRRAVFGGAIAAMVAPALPAAASGLPALRVGVITDNKQSLQGIRYRAEALNAANAHGHEPLIQLLIRGPGAVHAAAWQRNRGVEVALAAHDAAAKQRSRRAERALAARDAAVRRGDGAERLLLAPDLAMEAVAGLLDEGVHALITGPNQAIRAAANASCTPLITPSIDAVPAGPYVFNSGPSAAQVARALAVAAQQAGHRSVGLLGLDSLSTPDALKVFEEAAAARGLKLGEPQTFPATVTDLVAPIAALVGQQPDVLLLNVIAPFDGMAVRDARVAGWTGPILLTPEAANPGFHATAGPAAEGVKAALPWLAAPQLAPAGLQHLPALTRFTEGFSAAYGPAGTGAGTGADAISLLNLAFLGHRDKRAASQELERLCCMGATGVYNMTPENHSGLSDDALVMMTSADGAWKTA